MKHMENLTGKRFGKLEVIERTPSQQRFAYWKCKCDCGIEKNIRGGSLIHGITKSCGCLRKADLKGKTFSKLTVLELASDTSNTCHDRYWLCKCECGTIKKIRQTHLTRDKIQSCGCSQFLRGKNHRQWKGCGEFSGVFFNTIRHGAKTRNLEFNITPQEIWELFIKQNRKCALTGLDLVFSTLSGGNDGTASLDRIDSKRGYFIDNVQWVHKDINIMKMQHSQDKFISLCKLVVEKDAEREHSLHIV